MRKEGGAMKRLLLLGVGSALMFTMGGVGSAQADTNSSIHKSSAVTANGIAQSVTAGGSRCAGCHRAHTAKAEYLLKQAQPGLCYTCHGGNGSFLDVVDGTNPNADVSLGASNALRGGGFAYSLIDGAAGKMTLTAAGAKSATAKPLAALAALPVTSRHQIDGTAQGTMWGNGAISASTGALGSAASTGTPVAGDAGLYGVTLECGSCHDPHGNGNYRILKPVPSDAGKAQSIKTPAVPAVVANPLAVPPVLAAAFIPATYCTAADVLTAPCIPNPTSHSAPGYIDGGINGVNIPDAVGTRVYTTQDYWNVSDLTVPNTPGTAVDPTKPDGYIQNVAAWGTTCHTRYLAASGAWNTPNRGYVAKAINGTGTNATTGVIDATFTYRHRSESPGTSTKASPNCIQCHVSHGTSATMSGDAAVFTAPDGNVPTAGTGTAGAGSANKGLDSTISGGTAVGTSRLLRVNDRSTCKMCHNV